MLARLFTRPANVLVLDEPTNDLDLETLELLEAQLVEFSGTLLLVSHDRVFLDNVVTSTMVFEGNGRVEEYIGGYEDWLRQRPRSSELDTQVLELDTRQAAGPSGGVKDSAGTASGRPAAPKKLSYTEQRTLDQLPGRIEALEGESQRLSEKVAHPEFYREPADAIRKVLSRIDEVQAELLDAYSLWDALDSRSR
jgi:ATP-binding cassette subfamily F protein uup